MPREDFEVISVLGPLGAGKTTALNRLIEQVPLGDSYAVVVNDVGENNIDAQRIWDHPANRSEKIIPLTAGCIGCSDVTQFREALEQVHDAGVNVLFIEPTGIAPGTEIADVVRSSGFDLSILTLANARTVERDLKWQVLPSQLAVADIIGITHIPDASNEAVVLEQVLEQLPPLPSEVSVELIKPGMTDYFEVLAKLRGMDRQLRIGRQVVVACGCAHDHDDDHRHETHGISAKSFALKSSTTTAQVAAILRPYTHDNQSPLLRAKGVANGQRFDLVGDEWNVITQEGASTNIINVIFGGHIPAEVTKKLQHLSESVEPIVISGDKKSIVKSISDMPIEDRVAIVHERIDQYPAPISPLHGELIPDCEADEGYEIAFWGNNDDMSIESKRLAMYAYIQFRLDGLHELQHHGEKIVNVRKKSPYWLRRYGATLGYNGYYLSEYIAAEQLADIRNFNPAKALLDGLLTVNQLSFDEGRAEEKPEFLLSVFRRALEWGDIGAEDLEKLRNHILPLTTKNSDFEQRWFTTFQNLVVLT